MVTNPDSIDAVLKGLGLEVEKPSQEQVPQSVPVIVMYERSQGRYPYVVHCFVYDHAEIPEQVTEASLEGRLMEGQTTFNVESLRRFSEIIEALLELKDVKFHRSLPMLPSHSDNLVSYELVPRSDDAGGWRAYKTTTLSINTLYRRTGGNLVGRSL